MNLGILLSPGDSLNNMKKSGQADRFIELYLKSYAKNFEKVYLFSYEKEKWDLPENIILVSNSTQLHRLAYGFLLSLINYRQITDCDVIRGFGLASSISSFLLPRPFVFNWAYDYIATVTADKKYIYVLPYLILEKLAFLKAIKVLIATKSKFKQCKGKKFVYLPNGVDLNRFKKGKKFKQGILFVGRFDPQKNLHFLIKGVSLLEKNNRILTMVGSGSEQSNIKKWAKEFKVKLQLIKPMENLMLAKIIQNYSIFVLTSFREGVPKVLIEAMAVGLVPVVTSFPTASEIIENKKDGFITSFEESDFASAISKLLRNQKMWKKMSRNSHDKIVQQFNLDRLMEEEIGILKNA